MYFSEKKMQTFNVIYVRKEWPWVTVPQTFLMLCILSPLPLCVLWLKILEIHCQTRGHNNWCGMKHKLFTIFVLL